MRTLTVAAVVIVLTTLVGCDELFSPAIFKKNALDEIRARGELRVATLNLPTCYYLGAQGTEGLEYQLASAYATFLGVKLAMYPVANERALQSELTSGRADIAAASLTFAAEWAPYGVGAAPYTLVPQLVVYHRGAAKPRDTLQLESAKVAVRAGSAQERILQHLQNTVAPTLNWEQTAPSSADPVEDVEAGEADYAITDEREFSFAHHLYPNVLVGFALSEQRPVQWIVRRNAPALLGSVNEFFRRLASSGRLPQMVQESSGDTRPFAYEESREFQGNVNARLPQFRSWFEAAASHTGLDWRLLAAIGYQESKWNARAASGEGAVGVMMLTADTAQAMGVKDRTNPEQSIDAGARYLAQVRAMIPERIAEPDRTWLTVAAYNVGFGHLEDARVIAQARGKNPDSWADVREHLPLLAQPRWFLRAKRGYARGWEPVQFVDRIQRFLTLLEWQPGDSPAGEPVPRAARGSTGADASGAALASATRAAQ